MTAHTTADLLHASLPIAAAETLSAVFDDLDARYRPAETRVLALLHRITSTDSHTRSALMGRYLNVPAIAALLREDEKLPLFAEDTAAPALPLEDGQ